MMMATILLVPGAGVCPTGLNSLVGTKAIGRIDVATTAWLAGGYTHLLFSGGLVAPTRIQTKSEAELMCDEFLTRPGVDAEQMRERCILETRSWQTFENVQFSLELLTGQLGLQHVESIGVATHDEHFRRFRTSFRGWSFNRVSQLPVACQLDQKEQLLEEVLYLIHQVDPKGRVFGRAHRLAITARRYYGDVCNRQ